MKTIVVDLDGTLLNCNSFTEFVKFAFRRFPGSRIFLGAWVILRKTRLVSHSRAKEKIVGHLSHKINEDDITDFCTYLRGRINPEVSRLISGDGRVILATAAPALYAIPFAVSIGIPETAASIPGKAENKGKAKLAAVEALGVSFDSGTTVISDHTDDLPLYKANASGRNLMVTSEGIREIDVNSQNMLFP